MVSLTVSMTMTMMVGVAMVKLMTKRVEST